MQRPHPSRRLCHTFSDTPNVYASNLQARFLASSDTLFWSRSISWPLNSPIVNRGVRDGWPRRSDRRPHEQHAPPLPVANGKDTPTAPGRSKASGHTQRSTPPEPRRPIPSRWPAGPPRNAGKDHVLKRQGPFPAARSQWPPEPVFVPLHHSYDDRFRLNRAKPPFSGVVLVPLPGRFVRI